MIKEYLFKGIRKPDGYYTLDGSRKIYDPMYKKFSDFESLSKEEKAIVNEINNPIVLSFSNIFVDLGSVENNIWRQEKMN